ncbi:MAG: NAD+ synthase [Acidobacteria bacterium]|nr:NAD+ synthase [Acidobacteriota bacterium]
MKAAHRPIPVVAPSHGADLALNAPLVVRIVTGFIAEETRRTGRGRVVVGLSGGLDSAVAATLAVKALGRKGVVAVMMPFRESQPASLKDARTVARRLGVRHELVDISPMVDPYFERFPDMDALRRGNRMARERMNVLFDRSAAHAALVLGTSNKTELLLGYGTLFGDMASAINPIGDLYKTQVRQLAAHLGVPAAIRSKAPSADLWKGQTDEAELGATYAEADQILHLLFDERWEVAEVAEAGFERRLVDRLRRMVMRSQFKRRPPLIAKLSARTVGIDFRYPRDWGT